MNSRDITVYLDERWCNALEAHTGKTMETLLEEQIVPLIQQLPADQRSRITQEIEQEEEKSAQEAEANRRFSITRITENGESRYLLVEHGDIMFQTALRLRSYLRGKEQDPSRFYADAIPISQEEMERHTAEMVRGSPRVVGVYDIDLDAEKVYSLDPDKGWRGYQIKDVSTAAYFAAKKEGMGDVWRRARFEERMEGKELTYEGRPIFIRGSDRLPVSDLSFCETIEECEGMLNFYIPVYFNPDKVFGTHVETEANDDYLNLYANYDMVEGQVSNILCVHLWKGDGTMLDCEYRLTPEEQELLRSKMDSYCMEQMGISLETARAQYLAEDQSPVSQEEPSQKPVQQDGPTLLM